MQLVRSGILIAAESLAVRLICTSLRTSRLVLAPAGIDSLHQPIDAEAAVRALVRAHTLSASGEVDLVGPDVLTYRSLMRQIGVAIGRKPIFAPAPWLPIAAAGRLAQLSLGADGDAARALLENFGIDTVGDDGSPQLCSMVNVRPPSLAISLRRALGATHGSVDPGRGIGTMSAPRSA